jgi:hypothetical protein
VVVGKSCPTRFSGKTFDAPYLASLSADAVPPLLTSLGAMNEEDRRTVEEALRSRWSSSGEDWRTYNLGRSQARGMVDERNQMCVALLGGIGTGDASRLRTGRRPRLRGSRAGMP